ncbi:unnamed protein product [Rotaria sp. Silwood1]|nr:unnamed protein product [Rotaria sp. Silwood1]CAF3767305.1 unnamed protein product [Rotaria sp. Silwood1]
MFESKDEQHNEICQIKRFPCGTVVKIDHRTLLSWGIKEKSKKNNKNAKPVTSTKLVELLKVHTAHIVLRRTRWDPHKEGFVPEPKILWCSNAFTPVNASVLVHQYDYSPNKLQITGVTFSPALSRQNINQFNLQISYIIPEMYACTALKKKCLKAIIVTDSEQESNIHPNYKFMDGQKPVDSILIHVDQQKARCISKYLYVQAKDCKEEEYQDLVDLLSTIDYGFYENEEHLPAGDLNLTFEEERDRLAEAMKQYALPNILKGLRQLRQKRIKHKSNKEDQDWIKCKTNEDKIIRNIWKIWCHERECRPRAGIILSYFDTQGLAEILLTKFYKNNYIQYGYAKGKIEHGETVKDCAAREGAEELGLDAKIIYNLIQYSQPIKKNVFNVLENSWIEHYYFIIRLPNKNIHLMPNEKEIHVNIYTILHLIEKSYNHGFLFMKHDLKGV